MLRLFVCSAVLFLAVSAQASDLPDGEYDATVQTSSGTYTVPVEIEGGEVSTVHWPNGGNMSVRGADVYDGSASGYNSRGDRINIEIDDYSR